jgi:hypothetical protein
VDADLSFSGYFSSCSVACACQGPPESSMAAGSTGRSRGARERLPAQDTRRHRTGRWSWACVGHVNKEWMSIVESNMAYGGRSVRVSGAAERNIG